MPVKKDERREITFKPLPKQWIAWQFLEDDETFELLFGGGARGSKSYFGCAWMMLRRISLPGSAGLLGRRELKRMKATTLRTLFSEVCPALGLKQDVDYRFNAQNMEIIFPNGPDLANPWNGGSIIYCVDLAEKPSDPEYDRLGSYTLTDAFVDEAQEVPYKAVNVLKARFSLTKTDAWQTRAKVLYTCNPARNWIYQQFYKPWRDGTLAKEKKFVPSLVTDNPYVPQEYVENLRNSDDEITKQRLLYGNFEYDDDPTVLIQYNVICDLYDNNVPTGERFLTVDVARLGRDTTRFVVWDGLRAFHFEKASKWDTSQTIQRIKELEMDFGIKRSNVCIDQDGVGGGVVDQLRGCKPFMNGARAIQPPDAKFDELKRVNYANLKTQCVYKFKELAEKGEIRIDTKDVDLREMMEQELMQWRRSNPGDDASIRLVSKDDIRERLGRSPDVTDCFIFRMLFEIEGKYKTSAVSERPKTKSLNVRRRLFNPMTGDW